MINQQEFIQIRKEMEIFDKRRDIIIQKSHEIIRFSKLLIYAVHRDDNNVLSLVKQLKLKIRNLRTRGELQFSSFYKTAMQEYVEAVCFYEVTKNHKLPTKKQLFVSAPDYLSGLCDLTGELMRKANNFIINKKFKEVLFIENLVEEIYGEFLKLDIRDNDLRRKADAIKYNLQKIEDLANRIRIKR